MPSKFYFNRWWIAAGLAVACLLAWMILSTGSSEPIYQGRRLGSWLRGHPREYYPAVLAIGTNALPYLLAELQATDSARSEWGERLLAKASLSPFWRTARDRRYHAALGLQILDTNAVPALMNMIFSKPMRMEDGDASYSAALALRRLGWVTNDQVSILITQAMHSEDPASRRNACLALSLCPSPNDDFAASLVLLSQDPDATIRAEAMRAIMYARWNQELFLPQVVLRLNDEQAAIRRTAVVILYSQRSKAAAALPALRAAYTNEFVRPNLRGDLGHPGYVDGALSAGGIRRMIRDAIKAIDRHAPPPVDSP